MSDQQLESELDIEIPEVGTYVLETLTSGMYREARDAIREYIQNCLDSVIDAVANGSLPAGKGKVRLKLEKGRNTLSIHDNGTGIASKNAQSTLLGIGRSKKKLGENAGFRGIGRLAGTAYCKTLTFRTSTSGETTGTRVSIDCEELRSYLNGHKRNSENLIVALKESCDVGQYEEEATEHYFEVRLEDLINDGQAFLDAGHLAEYISQTCPCDYDNQKFIYGSLLRERIRGSNFGIPKISILIESTGKKIDVRKPYKSSYQIFGGDRVDINGIRYFEDTENGDFWVWYGDSDLPGQITDKASRGLRFRSSNIAIGGAEIFAGILGEVTDSATRFNSYMIGEIFVKPGVLVPNARRDGFEDTPEWRAMRKRLLPLARQFEQDIRNASKARHKSVKKVKLEAQKALDKADSAIDTGFASDAGKTAEIAKLQKAVEKVDAALKSRDRSDEEKAEISSVKADLVDRQRRIEKAKFVVGKLEAKLDRKQRKLLTMIFSILENRLDREVYAELKEEITSAIK